MSIFLEKKHLLAKLQSCEVSQNHSYSDTLINFASLQLRKVNIFQKGNSEYTMRVCINFDGFLACSLLAPCYWVGSENTHSECVLSTYYKKLR